jgi:hypothetical protein
MEYGFIIEYHSFPLCPLCDLCVLCGVVPLSASSFYLSAFMTSKNAYIFLTAQKASRREAFSSINGYYSLSRNLVSRPFRKAEMLLPMRQVTKMKCWI